MKGARRFRAYGETFPDGIEFGKGTSLLVPKLPITVEGFSPLRRLELDNGISAASFRLADRTAKNPGFTPQAEIGIQTPRRSNPVTSVQNSR